MSTPLSSLISQIEAIERAANWCCRGYFLSEEKILQERKILLYAAKTIEWISTHSDELKEFFAARKAPPKQEALAL